MAYRAIFDSKREFGIEIEGYNLSGLEVVELLEMGKINAYCGDNYPKNNTNKWIVSKDNTIEHTYPVEIISPRLSGSKGLVQVKKVVEILEKGGLKTDKSCGFHVHWNVSDYTGRCMINLLSIYAKYEKILDYFFLESRREDVNNHCRSLIKTNGIEWIYELNRPFFYRADQITQEFEKTQTLDPVTSFPSARHHKINLCSYNKYGTVEFRQHHGTLNYKEIESWIVFTQQIINRAKSTTIHEGIATLEGLIRTLGLSEQQLRLWLDLQDRRTESPRKDLLISSRDFYRKIYRENKEKDLVKVLV